MKTADINDIDRTRYKGHLSLCEIDLEGQRRLRRTRVLVVGAGGLGSPVCLYLGAAGVGTIGVVDPDDVSLSNLQRQIMHGTPDIGTPKTLSARRAVERINPEVEVETIREFLTEENAARIIGAYDIVVDCTDNLGARLVIDDTCHALGKPYVFGAVRRWGGQLFTYLPGHAGYRDIFAPDPDTAPDDLPCAIDGVLNTVVGVVGTLQATEVVKWAVGTGDLLTDTLLTFDAITMTFARFSLGN